MFDNSKVTDTTVMKPEPRKEGCELVEFKKAEKEAVIFGFKDSTGAVLNERVFMPTKIDQMTPEDFKKSINLTISKVAHIARAFLSEAEFNSIKVTGDTESLDPAKVAENWKQYIRLTAEALGVTTGKPKFAGVKCALKVVYVLRSGKYYVALPKVPPFISTQNHPKEFQTNPQYDIYNIPSIMPDAEKPNMDKNTVDDFGATAPPAVPPAASGAPEEPNW